MCKNGIVIIIEQFKEEKCQKEAAWNIEDEIKNRVVNTAFGIKTLLKNYMLNKILTKLQYENEFIVKLHKDRLSKKKEK